LGRPRKIIITEDTPVVAWYYERVLNHLHVPTKVLAAYLNADERKKVVDEFNNINVGVVVLLVMYAVSAQGLNLDPRCSRVLVTAPAVNTAARFRRGGVSYG
jgi:SNF2 family DNA or RNA helicase